MTGTKPPNRGVLTPQSDHCSRPNDSYSKLFGGKEGARGKSSLCGNCQTHIPLRLPIMVT